MCGRKLLTAKYERIRYGTGVAMGVAKVRGTKTDVSIVVVPNASEPMTSNSTRATKPAPPTIPTHDSVRARSGLLAPRAPASPIPPSRRGRSGKGGTHIAIPTPKHVAIDNAPLIPANSAIRSFPLRCCVVRCGGSGKRGNSAAVPSWSRYSEGGKTTTPSLSRFFAARSLTLRPSSVYQRQPAHSGAPVTSQSSIASFKHSAHRVDMTNGESEIRTHGEEKSPQRFSRPSHSTTLASLQTSRVRCILPQSAPFAYRYTSPIDTSAI